MVKEEEINISSSMDGGELHDDGVCVRWWPMVALSGSKLQEERKV